ncbi:MAG TPA: transcription termination/antitermination factor NusG [Verrucomicrobia bacterium]|nr:transcription termination/antitermination factor NusG [Verrucomicrobiota bacterium]HCG19492.1 transcription termination/antitermination factor NusG [Verrucomicrobiota bacterium]
MDKQWFVLHTLTGQENKVRKSIVARVKLERMEDYIGRCEIPTERVVEKKNGRTTKRTRMFFPGYVLCELALYDKSRDLDENGRPAIYERTWQFLRETPGLIGFVGSERPVPLKQSEVDAIFSNRPAGAPPVERPKIDFSVGETVKVIDGAFMGLTGQISMVDPDKGKLKVEVNIFSRSVQVDAEYWQVEKVPVEETFEPAE